MEEKDKKGISAKKLAALIKKLKPKRPEAPEADYSRWNQTEKDYRQEQAEWLETVRRKKEGKK